AQRAAEGDGHGRVRHARRQGFGGLPGDTGVPEQRRRHRHGDRGRPVPQRHRHRGDERPRPRQFGQLRAGVGEPAQFGRADGRAGSDRHARALGSCCRVVGGALSRGSNGHCLRLPSKVVLLLGLDPATPAVTVALHDGSQPLAQLVTVDAHRHAELLAPAIAKAIADAGAAQRDLTGIVAGVGPGPYTGLRVGLVTARVLGAALGIPVYGMCTLDAIAADVGGDAGASGEFLVATDARRRELYWARYASAGRRTAGPEVSKPAEIPVAGLPVAGEGPMLY